MRSSLKSKLSVFLFGLFLPVTLRAATTATTAYDKPAVVPEHAGAPLTIPLFGESSLTVHAQYRPRFHADTGKDFVKANGRTQITQRARLSTELKTNQVAIFLQLQDVRVWGEELDVTNDFSADGFDVHQAYADLMLLEDFQLRIGRQELNINNQRLIGSLDWAQRARSFDGGTLHYQNKNVSMMGLFAKIREADANNIDGSVPLLRTKDASLGGGLMTYAYSDAMKLTLLYLLHDQADLLHTRHTAGTNINGAFANFSYEAEFFYQFGKQQSETISAFLAALNLSYRLAALPWVPTLGARCEWLSGDGTPAGVFDTLYATNHKFYGEMDFFLNLPAQTQFLGLVDLGGFMSLTPVQDFLLTWSLHHFRSAESSAGGNQTWGTEVDTKLNYVINPWVSMNGVYGIFVPGHIMAYEFGRGDNQLEHLGFLTLNVAI